ncbi:MAG: glycosyltransferase family 4 protein [Myxococcales bacterium]|nr:glycosyltransferase family 4 protein [Myxococcales bacterium]
MTQTRYVFVSTEDDRHLVKGGIGTYLGLLTRVLARRGHPVDWVTQSPTANSFSEAEGGVSRRYLCRSPSESRARFGDRLARCVESIVSASRAADPDAPIFVEAPDWEGTLADSFESWAASEQVLRITRTHTPLVLCLGNNRLEATNENLEQIDRERRQMTNSDLLSSPTRYTLGATLKFALGGEAPCGTVVVPNCVDAARFRPDFSTEGVALERLRELTGVSLSADRCRLFVVGSLEHRKGVGVLQRAIPALFDLSPELELCWLGHNLSDTGSQVSANAKLTKEAFYNPIPQRFRDRVHLCGFVDHDVLPEIYPAADLFIFCYLSDNFPGALTEVGLSARPMVTLMRGGIPEIVTREGRPLTLGINAASESEIASQLVDAVRTFLLNRESAEALAAELNSHLRERFGEEEIVDQMQQAYRSAHEKKCASLRGEAS